MKERTRKIFIMIVMAALIVSLMAASFAALTYGRYSGGRRDENSAYEDILDLVGETAFEVSTADELVNAINNGYSYIKIAADAEEPFVVNNNVADVYTNLVLDVNGHKIVRNSRNPLLNVRQSVSVVLVYDSKRMERTIKKMTISVGCLIFLIRSKSPCIAEMKASTVIPKAVRSIELLEKKGRDTLLLLRMHRCLAFSFRKDIPGIIIGRVVVLGRVMIGSLKIRFSSTRWRRTPLWEMGAVISKTASSMSMQRRLPTQMVRRPLRQRSFRPSATSPPAISITTILLKMTTMTVIKITP